MRDNELIVRLVPAAQGDAVSVFVIALLGLLLGKAQRQDANKAGDTYAKVFACKSRRLTKDSFVKILLACGNFTKRYYY